MKTERRHELQQNELADALGEWINRTRRHWRILAGCLILVLAASIAWRVVSAHRRSQKAAAWSDYLAAAESGDPERQLEEVARRYADYPAGRWAEQLAANHHLQDAGRLLFVNRVEAEEELEAARQGFERVRDKADDQMLKQRAMYGLAQVYEAQNNLDQAHKVLQQIVQSWPDAPVADLARQRLEATKDKSFQTFYTWFYAQKVTPPVEQKAASAGETSRSTTPAWSDLPTTSDLGPSEQSSPEQPTGSAESGPVVSSTLPAPGQAPEGANPPTAAAGGAATPAGQGSSATPAAPDQPSAVDLEPPAPDQPSAADLEPSAPDQPSAADGQPPTGSAPQPPAPSPPSEKPDSGS